MEKESSKMSKKYLVTNNIRECYEILTQVELRSSNTSLMAKQIVQNVLTVTQSNPPFVYTEEAFERWLDQLYKKSIEENHQPHFLANSSKAILVEYIFQKTPQNINDANFLCKIGTIGLSNAIEIALLAIKFDEAGSGNVENHHGNIFYELITKDLGIKLSPATLHQDRRLIDSAFNDPVFQLAIGQFPKTFLPEILGMTLYLEWTGSLEAFRMVKLLKNQNINAKFYSVHVKADNPKNGHAFQIKETIKLYLRNIETDKQLTWKRIYQGWYSWRYILENFERDLRQHLVEFESHQCHRLNSSTKIHLVK